MCSVPGVLYLYYARSSVTQKHSKKEKFSFTEPVAQPVLLKSCTVLLVSGRIVTRNQEALETHFFLFHSLHSFEFFSNRTRLFNFSSDHNLYFDVFSLIFVYKICFGLFSEPFSLSAGFLLCLSHSLPLSNQV